MEARGADRLQAQLAGHGLPPGGKEPIPKLPPPAPSNPDPSRPGSPGTNKSLAPDLNLAGMSPRRFAETLELCDNKTLKILLARETGKPGPEQDAGVIAKLYKELKKRGA
jgi:hypothetical protein